MTARLGPPLDLLLEPHLPAEQIQAAADRFREIYPDLAVEPTPAFPGVAAALAAVRRHGGRILLVTGKYTPNAQLHVDHLGLDVDVVEGRVWGTGKGEVLARHGADVYVGDHVHDVEGARAAGVTQRLGADRRLHPRGARGGRHRRRARRPRGVPGLARRPRPGAAAAQRSRTRCAHTAGCWSPSAGEPTARSCSRRRCARSAPDNVAAATAYSDSLPRVRARTRRGTSPTSLGVEVLTPRTAEMEREGYRANDGDRCAFCKAELLDVLGPLAERARVTPPSRPAPTPTTPGPGFRPGHRGRRRARRRDPAARRRTDQGPGPGRLPRLGAADLGQARGGLPELAGRLRHRDHPGPAGPGRAGRGRAAARPGRGRSPRSRDLRVRDLGDRARVEVDRGPGRRRPRSTADVVRAAGFEDVEVDPLGFRSGSMNELLAEPDRYR